MRQINFPHKQQGVVIVIALFIVALVATMSYVMLERLARDTSRTTKLLNYYQAEQYAQGSVMWAMEQLKHNWEQQQQGQVVDKLPLTSPSNSVNDYRISSTIEDMQGRFNLNNLSSVETQGDFLRLLRALNPELKQEDAYAIVQGTVDWVSSISAENMFTKYYRQLPQPYRAAHRVMVSPSEWRLVKGVTSAIYKVMSPYLTALPETTLINFQTAPAAVLLTLDESMTMEAAKAVADARTQAMPAKVEAFTALDVVKNHQIPPTKLTATSSYFLVRTDVSIEKQHLLVYTLLQRATKQNKARVTISWQSIGAW